jgi:hypothetical protein
LCGFIFFTSSIKQVQTAGFDRNHKKNNPIKADFKAVFHYQLRYYKHHQVVLKKGKIVRI